VAFSFREEGSLPPVLPPKVACTHLSMVRDPYHVARMGSVVVRCSGDGAS